MDKRYTVQFFGTAAEGERRLEVMREVQRLLKLDTRQLIALFDASDGVTLLNSDNREQADRMVRSLTYFGARCRLKDAEATETPDWASWELVDKNAEQVHIFHCRACGHSIRLPVQQALPTTCPECGVVAAKYDQVAQKKRERERIRQSILAAEQAKAEKAGLRAQQAREDALRKQIEAEVRRELGLRYRLNAPWKSIAAAALLIAVGAAGMGTWLNMPDAALPGVVTADAGNRESTHVYRDLEPQQTLYLADRLVQQITEPTPGDNAREPDGSAVAAQDPEPWLNAPATAAGRALPHPDASANTALVAGKAGRTIDETVAFWLRTSTSGALHAQRVSHLAKALTDQGRFVEALEASELAASAPQRLMLLRAIVSSDLPTADAAVAQHLQQTQAMRREQPVMQRLVDLMVLDQLARADRQPGGARLTRAAVFDLLDARQVTPVDAIAVYALLAMNADRLQYDRTASDWFAAANALLRDLPGAEQRLSALAHLAVAYQARGDAETARAIAKRIRTIMLSVGEQGQLTDGLATTLSDAFAELQLFDQAVEAADLGAGSTLASQLRRAELATLLAGRGQRFAARGIIATLSDRAARARSRAQCAAIAGLQGDRLEAMRMIARSTADTRGLPSLLSQAILSDLPSELMAESSDFATGETTGTLRGAASAQAASRLAKLVSNSRNWQHLMAAVVRERAGGNDPGTHPPIREQLASLQRAHHEVASLQ